MKKIKKWRDAFDLAQALADNRNLLINYYDDSTGPEDWDAMIMVIGVVGVEIDYRGMEKMKVLIHNDANGHDRTALMALEEIADLFWNNRRHINRYIQEVRA